MLSLENHKLRLDLLPKCGGRIERLIDLKTKKDWVWHSHSYDGPSEIPRNLDLGSNFDLHWSGGWEEVFPNDAPLNFEGSELFDHGELWSQAWDLTEQGSLSATLVYHCKSVPVILYKTVRIDPIEPIVTFDYKMQNTSHRMIPYLFKLHPALRIEEGDRLLLPDCKLRPVDLGFSTIAAFNETTDFPYVKATSGKLVAIDRIAAYDAQTREFIYASSLEAGYCGLRNPKSRSELVFNFDRQAFPYVWVLQSLGGFHEHFVLLLEPCNSPHYDLMQCWQKGEAPCLAPMSSTSYQVTVEIHHY